MKKAYVSLWSRPVVLAFAMASMYAVKLASLLMRTREGRIEGGREGGREEGEGGRQGRREGGKGGGRKGGGREGGKEGGSRKPQCTQRLQTTKYSYLIPS